MNESQLIVQYEEACAKLKTYGYYVSPLSFGFYINNDKGMTIADCKSVDGLHAFAQALDMIAGTLA